MSTSAFPTTALRGRAVIGHGIIDDALIAVDGARFAYVGPAADAPAPLRETDGETVDGMILPGLIDVHCHGGAGVSFPDLDSPGDALRAITEHRRAGTTRMLASLVTAAEDTLDAALTALSPLVTSGDLLGVHLEGPFISPERAGAQNPAHITAADAGMIRRLGARHPGVIASMTIAPEAAGAKDAYRALAEIGAVPSLGHTDASSPVMSAGLDSARAALAEHGRGDALPTVTHLFNAMRPIHHREPGPVLAALDAAARGGAVVELIADGVHLAPQTVAHVAALVPAAQILLVTDAMAAAGMPDGAYQLGSLAVTVTGGVARLTEGGAIAGGTAHLLDVVRCAVRESGLPIVDAVRSASAVPAAVLRRSGELGELRAGAVADLLVVGEDLQLQRVMRDGAWLERDAA